MRKSLATLMLLALGAILIGCGGSNSTTVEPAKSSSMDDVGSELVNMPLTTGNDGEAATWKSEPFTTKGGPLMVEFEITEHGTYVYGGLENEGWVGNCRVRLMEVDGYYNEDTAPLWSPDWIDGVDKYRGQILTPDGTLPPAGGYQMIVIVQNLMGSIRLVELPQ